MVVLLTKSLLLFFFFLRCLPCQTLEDQLETIRGDKHAVESAKWTLEEENKVLEMTLRCKLKVTTR